MTPWFALAAAVMLAFFLLRSRRRVKRLEAALEFSSRNLERLQGAFQRFAPEDVVEDIIRRGVSVQARRRSVTVLLADIVDFTALSEKVEPEELVRLLNEYFASMSRAISTNRGRVIKFIGDGILAVFGAPDPNPWHEADAVRAALAMREELARYNTSREVTRPISIGIGIHTGDVVAGVIGSAELMEYTVIGDVVNTASRIESLTRTLNADILISEDLGARLDDQFRLRPCGSVALKGKSAPITIFAVDGPTG